MRGFLQQRDYASIRNMLSMLHEHREDSPYRAFMPPLVGTDTEIEALAAYLHERVKTSSSAHAVAHATAPPPVRSD